MRKCHGMTHMAQAWGCSCEYTRSAEGFWEPRSRDAGRGRLQGLASVRWRPPSASRPGLTHSMPTCRIGRSTACAPTRLHGYKMALQLQVRHTTPNAAPKLILGVDGDAASHGCATGSQPPQRFRSAPQLRRRVSWRGGLLRPHFPPQAHSLSTATRWHPEARRAATKGECPSRRAIGRSSGASSVGILTDTYRGHPVVPPTAPLPCRGWSGAEASSELHLATQSAKEAVLPVPLELARFGMPPRLPGCRALPNGVSAAANATKSSTRCTVTHLLARLPAQLPHRKRKFCRKVAGSTAPRWTQRSIFSGIAPSP